MCLALVPAVLALHGGVVGVELLLADEAVAIAIDAGEFLTFTRMRGGKFVARDAAVFVGINAIERVLRGAVLCGNRDGEERIANDAERNSECGACERLRHGGPVVVGGIRSVDATA